MVNQLVFDVGMHQGEDTDYYLSKGYRVIAVDADPSLIERASQQFGEAEREGKLVLVNLRSPRRREKPTSISANRPYGTR